MLNVVEKIRDKIELAMSDEYTIENYFRRKGLKIGKGNRIYIRYLGGEPYLVRIGDHCTITDGVKLITHDGGCWVFRREIPELNHFGKIDIKDNCFIGMNSIILPNVTIGPNSVVGAGAVVTRDVPPDSVVVGVPAQVVCSIDEYKEKCIKRWKALGLKGERPTWKKQLIEHFWTDLSD